MEILLAVVIFGLMAVFTGFGFVKSAQASRGKHGGRGASLVMTGGETKMKGAPSPGRKTEDHAMLSEVAEPVGASTVKPREKSGLGEQRPQAERPLSSGDVGP